MADKDKHDADKYRERDERIMERLRSSDDAERAAGMVQVEQTYRIPLAIVLYRNAREGKSAAYEIILDVNLHVDEEAFGEIWRHTKACLYENTQKDNFEFKGNLLAYLVKIALRRIEHEWSKQFVGILTDHLDFLGGPDNSHEKAGLVDLLDAIEGFANTLSESDQTAFWIGMRFATDGPSTAGRKVFAEKVRRSGAWDGRDETIARRYVRLREKLRQFLREEGYDV